MEKFNTDNKKGDVTGSDHVTHDIIESDKVNENVIKDLPEKNNGMIKNEMATKELIDKNENTQKDDLITINSINKKMNNTNVSGGSTALQNQTISIEEATRTLETGRIINAMELADISKFDYIIKGQDFMPWPTMEYSSDITLEASNRNDVSGHDIKSKQMAETNMAVWTQSGAEKGSDVYDAPWINVGNNSVNIISEVALAPIFTLLKNQNFFSYNMTSEMNVNSMGVIASLFDDGQRSLVHTPVARNGHPVVAAMNMYQPSRTRIMNQVNANNDDERKMKLGVNHALTLAGARNVIQYSHEVVKPEQACISEVMFELAQTDTISTILEKIIPSIVEKNGSGYYAKSTVNDGPVKNMDPYITPDGVQMAMLLMCGSKLMRNHGNSLVQQIGSMTPFEVNETVIQNLRTALANNQFGANLNEAIRGVSINDVLILLHASVAPYLYDIEQIDDMTTSSAALPAFVEMLAILFEYILFPAIAHKRDHILIPRLMNIINANFTFGKNYINTSRYSNDELFPTAVEQERFYDEGGYPNILKINVNNNLTHQIVHLREILLYQGEDVGAERQYDVDNKIFKTAIPFIKPDSAGRILDERLLKLRQFIQDCQDDKSREIWKGRTKEEVNTAVEEVILACIKNTRILHYALGHIIRTFASLPVCPLGLPNLFDTHGTSNRPIMLARQTANNKTVVTPSYRTKINVPITTAMSIFVGASSKLFNSHNGLENTVGYSNESIVKGLVEKVGKLFEEGTKAGIALMAANVATEYITNSLEVICPLDEDNQRNFVTDAMANLSRGNPEWIVTSEDSDDIFTDPKYVSQLNKVRPDPARFFSKIISRINEEYPSMMGDLVTTSNDFLARNKSEGPMYYFIYTDSDIMRSPDIYFTEEQYTRLFAMMMQRQIDPSSRENGFTRGLILCETQESRVDRFGLLEGTFNYTNLINTKTYTEPGKAPTVYRKMWLVESFNEDVVGVPDDIDGYATITAGGTGSINMIHNLDPSVIYALYLCDKDDYDPYNPANWVPYNYTDNIILEVSSANKLATMNDGPKIIKNIISRTASQNMYPGSFVFVDKQVIVNVSPIKTLLNNTSPRHDDIEKDTEFYFNSPDLTSFPSLYNDVWNIRTGMGFGRSAISTIVKMYDGSKSIARIAATRPNTTDDSIGGQSIWNYQQYSSTYDVTPYWALFDEDGEALDGLTTSLTSLLGGERQVVHLVTQVNSGIVQTIDQYRFVYKKCTH